LTWASGGALAADVAGLILPGVTGGGALVRTVAHGAISSFAQRVARYREEESRYCTIVSSRR